MKVFRSSRALIWKVSYTILFLSGTSLLIWFAAMHFYLFRDSLPWVYQKSLQAVVEETLKGEEGSYGVAVKHLGNGEEVRYNADEQMVSASLYKLAVLYSSYMELETGALSLDEGLEMTAEAAVQLDEDEFSVPFGATTTVRDAIEQMITVSDNASAILLLQRLGSETVNRTMRELGLKQTEVGVGDLALTSPEDILLLLEKIYRGEEQSQAARQEMIEVLLRQTINDRLPARLPQGTPVAHKTGELFSSRHDAGIVFAPRGAYIIVVMTQDLPNIDRGIEVTAMLSKKVYDYFSHLDS